MHTASLPCATHVTCAHHVPHSHQREAHPHAPTPIPTPAARSAAISEGHQQPAFQWYLCPPSAGAPTEVPCTPTASTETEVSRAVRAAHSVSQ